MVFFIDFDYSVNFMFMYYIVLFDMFDIIFYMEGNFSGRSVGKLEKL